MKLSLPRVLDFLLYAGLIGLVVLFVSRKLSGPDSGKPAALFDLPIADEPSRRFRLADHRGKPVLIEVFAGWCGACRRAAPTLVEAWERHGPQGVAFVGVSLDGSLEEAARVKREWQIPYDVALDDGSMAREYKIEVLPTFVLVDRDGLVRQVSTGAPSKSQIDRWLSHP